MQHWTITSGSSRQGIEIGSAARLVGAVGHAERGALANATLAAVRAQAGVHHCSILIFEGDRSPRLMSAASVEHQWHVVNIASVYARDFFRQDALQALIGRYPASFEAPTLLVHRQRAEEIADAAYRAQCYDCIGIGERLSVLVRVSRSQSLAINLYRDSSSGAFADADVQAVIDLAPLLAACATRHYALDAEGVGTFRGAVNDELAELCPQLTLREREVVQRILDGATTERIADDLHIRPTTVVTYRNRAYEKLGVASRRELFAAVLRRRAA